MAKNNKKSNKKNVNNKKDIKPISLVLSLASLYIIVILIYNMIKANSITIGLQNFVFNFKTNGLAYLFPMIVASFGVLIGKSIADKQNNKNKKS